MNLTGLTKGFQKSQLENCRTYFQTISAPEPTSDYKPPRCGRRSMRQSRQPTAFKKEVYGLKFTF